MKFLNRKITIGCTLLPFFLMQENPVSILKRRKMSAEKFVKIWKREIEDEREELVLFRKGWLNEIIIVFYNIEVEGDIVISDNDDPLIDIILSNCVLDRFLFLKGKARSVAIEQNSIVNEIRIGKSSAIGNIKIITGSEIKQFEINKCTIDRSIWESSTIKNLSVRGCRTDDFYVKNCEINAICFENCNTGKLIVHNSKINSLRIQKKAIIGPIFIENSNTRDLQITSNNSTIQSFTFKNSPVESIIFNSSIIGKIQVWRSFINNIIIKAGCFVSYLQIQPNIQEQWFVKESAYGSLA